MGILPSKEFYQGYIEMVDTKDQSNVIVLLFVSTVSTYTVKTIRMAPYLIACMYQQCRHVEYPGSCKSCFSPILGFGRKISLIIPIIYQIAHLVDPVHLFLSLSSESEFHQKPPPIALSAVACININL